MKFCYEKIQELKGGIYRCKIRFISASLKPTKPKQKKSKSVVRVNFTLNEPLRNIEIEINDLAENCVE